MLEKQLLVKLWLSAFKRGVSIYGRFILGEKVAAHLYECYIQM